MKTGLERTHLSTTPTASPGDRNSVSSLDFFPVQVGLYTTTCWLRRLTCVWLIHFPPSGSGFYMLSINSNGLKVATVGALQIFVALINVSDIPSFHAQCSIKPNTYSPEQHKTSFHAQCSIKPNTYSPDFKNCTTLSCPLRNALGRECLHAVIIYCNLSAHIIQWTTSELLLTRPMT